MRVFLVEDTWLYLAALLGWFVCPFKIFNNLQLASSFCITTPTQLSETGLPCSGLVLLVADTRLHLAVSVGRSRNIFEMRAVFALLLLPNRPRQYCRVSGLVFTCMVTLNDMSYGSTTQKSIKNRFYAVFSQIWFFFLWKNHFDTSPCYYYGLFLNFNRQFWVSNPTYLINCTFRDKVTIDHLNFEIQLWVKESNQCHCHLFFCDTTSWKAIKAKMRKIGAVAVLLVH